MRALLLIGILALGCSAESAEQSSAHSKWLRISATDGNSKQLELCNYQLTKCSQFGKKASYSMSDLRSRHKAIRNIRNRTLAVKYASMMLGLMVGAPYLGPSLIGAPKYKTYVVALEYMKAIENAAETETLASAQILVESSAALEIVRAALDAKF